MTKYLNCVLSVALVCVAQAAGADIIYNVNITDGTETITGTITTDGTLGSITSFTHILGFHLTVTGSALAFGPIDLSIPVSAALCGPPCAIASSTTLLPSSGELELGTAGVGEIDFLATEIDITAFGGVQISDALDLPNGYTIGTVSGAPEPATLALLGIGLAGFGYSRRKRKQ